MTRLRPSAVWLALALCCLGLPSALGFGPQNHRTVPKDGVCIAASLAKHDFCAPVVDYTVASTLLASRRHLVSPIHSEEHEALIEANELGILSAHAKAEFDSLLAHHLEVVAIAQITPGAKQPDTAKCEALLARYTCQTAFPRCFDDPAWSHHDGRPIMLHVCYSLCHETRTTCALQHRLDCRVHHRQLNHEFVQPDEHTLKFDDRYKEGQDPYAEFHHIDCVDSPPSRAKHLMQYLFYGGPGSIALYTLAALVLYTIVAKLLDLRGDSNVATVAKLRAKRMQTRLKFDGHMRKLQKKYVNLQEIKTVMVDQQEADRNALEQGTTAAAAPSQSPISPASSPSSATSSPTGSERTVLTPLEAHALFVVVRDRSQKLEQLDELIGEVEAEIQRLFTAMRQQVRDENREDEQLGFTGEEGQRLMAEAEAELDEQTYNPPSADGESESDAEEEESDQEEDEQVRNFGRRRHAQRQQEDQDEQS